MSNPVRTAIYARVSSEQQAKENTIGSQLEGLKERVAAEGLPLDEELCFVDDGQSGATLMRRRWSDCATPPMPAPSIAFMFILRIVCPANMRTKFFLSRN